MNLDIRYPIGLLFLAVGVILAGYGLVSGPEIYATHSLGLNINLWWGLIQIAFGAIMVALAKMGAKKG
ncbi:MAG TPA: hypothetical protein VFE25_15725 [Opitutaceae bacterium]|jgi:hypothetical protein|nr:hypothetical protein [Opitutaceae bacterium]